MAAPSNPPNYQLKHEIKGHSKMVSSLKFSPTGNLLGSASGDKTVCLWNVDTGECVRTLSGHEKGLNDLAWTDDAKTLCSASDDTNINLYNTETGQLLHTFQGHTHYVFSVCFNRGGTMLASGSFDESLILWDTRSGQSVRKIAAHSEPVTSVDFELVGNNHVVSSSYDGICRVWNVGTGLQEACLPKPDENQPRTERPNISAVKFTPNGKFLLISTQDSMIRLWDWRSQKCLKTYRGHENKNLCIFNAFSTNNHHDKVVVSGSEDHKVYIWNLQSREVIQALEGHKDPVLSVSCHPTRALLASCGHGHDATIRIWESSSPSSPSSSSSSSATPSAP